MSNLFPNTSVSILPHKTLKRTLKEGLLALNHGSLHVNCNGVSAHDSISLAALVVLQAEATKNTQSLLLNHVSAEFKKRLMSVPDVLVKKTESGKNGYAYIWGDAAIRLWNSLYVLLFVSAEAIYWSTFGRFSKQALPICGTSQQILRLGCNAFPIVILLSFLIGLTLSYQSAVQLELLGGSIYLIRGIGISMFSEVGPLMTAIILAGRSGSAITAEIASMVVLDEVKALKSMGIQPVPFLVVPRFLAMIVSAPLLTYVSVMAGVFACIVIAMLMVQMPFVLIISELQNGIPLKLIWQCGVKSIAFGWIISIVACQQGFAARGGATSVGVSTTKSVVFSISAIIIMDAVFSVIFY